LYFRCNTMQRVVRSLVSSSFLQTKAQLSYQPFFQINFFASKSITINLEKSFKTHKCESPPTSATTNREELLDYYQKMNVIRRVETTADTLYKSKNIRGFLHLYSGQEAVCIGMEASLTKEDHVITAYREHGNFIARGGTPGETLAELMGKVNGCSRGKGGSMHMYKKSINFYGGNGIVGAQIPIGAGLALAQQYKNTGRVAVAMYGDGAANQGQVFESFNMAALWKLPVIFVCENNHYAMGTSQGRSTIAADYYTRGDFVPGIRVDGMNVISVKVATKFAIEWAQKKGPIILEMDTYRYSGHSMSDPGTTYRSRDEITKMRDTKDPLSLVKGILISNQLATEEEIKEIDKKVKLEVDAALQFARDGKEPPMSELYEHVLVDTPCFIRAVELPDSINPQNWPSPPI